MNETQVSVIDQIKLIIAGANPDEIKDMPMLGKIHQEMIEQEEKKKKVIAQTLKSLVELLGMVEKQNSTVEEFAKNYLRIRGYKKFGKRAGRNGQTQKQRSVITNDQISQAKKAYNDGKGDDLRKIAKSMGLNTNSLKKALGISRFVKVATQEVEAAASDLTAKQGKKKG
jgi:hypothetical protein